MATYGSYKKIISSQYIDGSIPKSKLSPSGGPQYNVLWVYGSPNSCTGGCCCLWTVPSGVKRVTFELWGAGGNGNGACSCSRCHHYFGAQGGYYNTKTVLTVPGCQYTICAGGVYPCLSRECTGCNGCTSYVNGYNLSNFCAQGGATGCANTAWSTGCFSEWGRGCVGPVSNGGDFAIGNHAGAPHGHEFCHCLNNEFCTTGAPFLSGGGSHGYLDNCWIRCGCWTAQYGSGGQSAMTSYCGTSCCGQGGTGGSGVVKVTYV
jgi:hypothetical protein